MASLPRTIARVTLGSFLVLAGVSHLTFARKEFVAQVPRWMPVSDDAVVLGSGAVEIALGSSLALAPRSRRPLVGTAAALFFTAIFPGNVSQWTHRVSAFGLDTDAKRFGRLFFQPLLVATAIWATRTPKV
jgi:uncharacterized membrane protein